MSNDAAGPGFLSLPFLDDVMHAAIRSKRILVPRPSNRSDIGLNPDPNALPIEIDITGALVTPASPPRVDADGVVNERGMGIIL